MFTGISSSVFAVAESEPNNTWNQADVITLGATGTGTAGVGYNEDWWRVTSALDGKLTVTFTATIGLYVYCEIYDTLGTVLLSSNYTNGTLAVEKDGLAAGTYYIKLVAYYSTEAPSYSFVPTWTTPAQTIDNEPNNTRGQAKTLALNGSVTGHVGYYYNNKRDTIDWWKVTTNKDGRLDFTITSHNGYYIYAYLYDNDGVTFLSGYYTNGTSTFSYDGLAVGTYYITVFSYYNSEFEPYTLSNTLVLPPCVNDLEPNGTPAQALTINIGDSLVGHVGYYYNHYRDTVDWYKVTTTLDGQLNYKISSLNGSFIYLNHYDNDGVTQLAGGSYTNGTLTFVTDGLAAGTYYLKVYSYYDSQFEPYSIKVTQTIPPVTNDVEPNDKKSQAKTINPNDSITGHVGYYYNHKRDTFDYRKITLAKDGRLDWTINSQNGDWIYAELYDNNATTYLGGGYTSTILTFSKDGLAAGTYYLKIFSYYDSHFNPYYLKTKFYPTTSDPEPNGTYATASAITLNDSLKGTVSYYYNGKRDTIDWFKLTTNNDGQLNVTLYSLNSQWVYLTVYDNNGTTVLYGPNYTTTSTTFTMNDAGKGTYYIRVNAWDVNAHVSYALVNSLVNNNPNDPEENNYAKNSPKIGGYTTRTGNINYRQNGGANDAVDWWRLSYYNLGNLDITVNKVQHTFDANYPDVLYRLYLDTTLTPLDSVQLIGNVNTSYNHVYTGLSAGTYYVRITPLNNTFGGYTVKANYKDTTSQTVSLVYDSAGTTCGAGKLAYLITRGKPPYSVQLYKDGVALGSAVTTSDTAKFTSLDAGYYSVTARSSIAATYTVSGKDTTIVPKPVGLAVPAATLTATSAILKWTGLACVDGYKLQWRPTGTTAWTTIFQPAGATQDTITGLTASTGYQFRVYAYVTYIGTTKYYGKVSAVKSFTTPALRMADLSGDVSVSELEIYPNPATDRINFAIDDAAQVTQIIISNAIGQQVKVIDGSIDLGQSFDASMLQRGIYFVTIKTSGNIYTSRFVKEQILVSHHFLFYKGYFKKSCIAN